MRRTAFSHPTGYAAGHTELIGANRSIFSEAAGKTNGVASHKDQGQRRPHHTRAAANDSYVARKLFQLHTYPPVSLERWSGV